MEHKDFIFTQFLMACNKGNFEYVKQKIAQVHDINAKNTYGHTALTYAALRGHLNIVQYLLTNNPQMDTDINIPCVKNMSPLMYACQNGHLDVVKYLLSSPELTEHADPYLKNVLNYNALMLALRNDFFDIATYLILDKKLLIDDTTQLFLLKRNYDDFIHMIKTRDVYEKISQNTPINQKPSSQKTKI